MTETVETDIDRNIRLRKLAKSLKAFIDDELANIPVSEHELFWRKLIEESPIEFTPTVEPAKIQTYDEARKWSERTRITFGQYNGMRVCDIPANYLEWMAGQPDFRKQLEFYMRSPYYRDSHGATE